MKTVAVLLLLMYLPAVISGQEQLWRHIPPTELMDGDSARMHAYLSAAYRVEPVSSDSAVAYYARIFAAAHRKGYYRGIDSTLMYLHRCLWTHGTNAGKAVHLRAIAAYSDDPGINRHIMIRILEDIGVTSLYMDQYARSGYYFNKALSLFRPGDTDQLSRSLKQSLYCSLASLWTVMHEEQHAFYWLEKAERYAVDSGEAASIAVIKCTAYTKLGDKEKAYHYARKAVALSDRTRDAGTASAALLNLAQTLIEKNRPGEALQYLRAGIARRRAYQEQRRMSGISTKVFLPNDLKYNYLSAKAHMQLGNYRRARELLINVKTQQHHHGFRGDLLETLGLLSQACARAGNFREAWAYHEEYTTLSDSLNRLEKSSAVDAEIRYQTAEKDRQLAMKELSLMRSEQELRRKNTLIIGISSGTVLLLGLFFSLYRSGRHRQKLQAERIRLMQQGQEISQLKAMMHGEEKERARLARELHDGIMVQLSAIKMRLRTFARQQQDEAGEQELRETLRQLDNTTKELRQSAHSLMPDMLLEGGLAEAVFYFCKNLPTGPGLRINFQQYGEIPRLQPELEIALYRILQELVQNIIKHACATKGLVQFNYREGMLYITVEDNGMGFDVHEQGNRNGMGLKGIRTRMRALNGIMDISSHRQSGTSVNLEFDVRSVIVPENEKYTG